jgi:cytoskeleton protein RodZ
MANRVKPVLMNGELSMSDLATTSLNGQSAGDVDHSSSSDTDAVMAQTSAGGLLKQAREAAGLHIAALAVALKVPVKKLEALESDRFDLLPDAVFVRALASSVCRTLKIDAAPVLQRLPQTSSPKLTYQGAGINAPFRAPGDGPSPSIWTQISRPAVLAGLILLIGALVLIFLPALKTGVKEVKSDLLSGTPDGDAANAAAVPPILPAPLVPEMGRVDSIKPPTDDTDPALAGLAASSALLTRAQTTSATSVSSETSVPQARPSASLAQSIATPGNPASAALTSIGIVVFSAKSESWVEVTDSKGQVVLRRILNAGEVVGATGALPLSAIVGRADVTAVQVRGKAFDLSAVAKDNVARFEVK